MKRKIALFAAILMLLPTVLSGCISADELAARREKTEEISKKSVEYMRGKYNRGFKVKKCEEARGDAYQGDFFITFTNDVHAFYNTEEEKFYDDRQSSVINEAIYNDVWTPLIDEIGLLFDNIGLWSQDFNLVYEYDKGNDPHKFSMYHDYFYGGGKEFCRNNYISVRTDNLILVSDTPQTTKIYNTVKDCVTSNFKGKHNDVRFYIVTEDCHRSTKFDASAVDETMDGCLAAVTINSETGSGLTRHQFVPVEGVEGLYAMFCSRNAYEFKKGDISLEPVSNSDAVSKKILDDMNSKELGLVDKYITKKRSITFDELYTVKLSDNVVSRGYDEYTLAFVMKDSDEMITDYAKINERERSFFGYELGGDEFNATCLCSQNSRSNKLTFGRKSETYFWYGTQF